MLAELEPGDVAQVHLVGAVGDPQRADGSPHRCERHVVADTGGPVRLNRPVEDLEREITRVRAGDESPPDPLPVYTTEEVGQVAHAVDELHTQALLLAGDEARLRLLVNDMFETMSRRSRSLVDQQLSLIDGLGRNE